MSRPMDEPHLLSIIYAYKEIKRWQAFTPGVQKDFSEKVRLDEILKYRLERALTYIELSAEVGQMGDTDRLKEHLDSLGYSWKVGRSANTGLYYSHIDTGEPDFVVGYGQNQDSELKVLNQALEEVRRIITDG